MREESSGTARPWGVEWFLWNLPLLAGVVTVAFLVAASIENVARDGALDPADVLVTYFWGGIPILSIFGSLAGSGLIAAFWAVGLRNRLVVRLLLAAIPSLLALPASENGWMLSYFVSAACGIALVARLPGGSAAT
jgi:hypothetical protein